MSARQAARIGGWAAIIAGATGAGGAAALLLVPPTSLPGTINYPLTPSFFVVLQIVFSVHHVLIAAALWTFTRAGLAGDRPVSRAAGGCAAVLMALLGGWELVVLTALGIPYPSPQTAWIDTGYGVLSLLSGLALVLLGICTARSRVLDGAWRWLPLVLGVYVFVPMTPSLFAGFVAGRIAIGCWLLMFMALGIGMLTWADRSAASPVDTDLLSSSSRHEPGAGVTRRSGQMAGTSQNRVVPPSGEVR